MFVSLLPCFSSTDMEKMSFFCLIVQVSYCMLIINEKRAERGTDNYPLDAIVQHKKTRTGQ
jgi:hypothetical protein